MFSASVLATAGIGVLYPVQSIIVLSGWIMGLLGGWFFGKRYGAMSRDVALIRAENEEARLRLAAALKAAGIEVPKDLEN